MATRAIRGWRVIRWTVSRNQKRRVDSTYVLAATRREAKSIAIREQRWYGATLSASREPTAAVAARLAGLPPETAATVIADWNEQHNEPAIAAAIRADD